MDAELQLILKQVSRSFFLSLQLLPRPMRSAASVAYLLARASDTIADTAGRSAAESGGQLLDYQRFIRGETDLSLDVTNLHEATAGERALLHHLEPLRQVLKRLPDEQQQLIEAVLTEIISGQMLDVHHFAHATSAQPAALADEAAVIDYCDRVAGSVGEFWTLLADLTLDADWSVLGVADMVHLGREYGRGLQLVNILRDMPADRRIGRCYLPGVVHGSEQELLAAHALWCERAEQNVRAGLDYSGSLRSRRLCVASVLPALLGLETLERLRGVSMQALQQRVKISRLTVWHCVAEALVF